MFYRLYNFITGKKENEHAIKMFLLVLLKKKIKSDKSHNPNFHAHSLEQMRIIMYIQKPFNINFCLSSLHWYCIYFSRIIFAAPIPGLNFVLLPCIQLCFLFAKGGQTDLYWLLAFWIFT